MTVTRSQTGHTPRKPIHPDFVETPTRKRRSQKSLAPNQTIDESAEDTSGAETDAMPDSKTNGYTNGYASGHANGHANGYSNGHANGYSNGHANGHITNGAAVTSDKETDEKEQAKAKEAYTDPKVDDSGVFEFGGSLGVSAMMVGFPLLMYYMWLGATYYDGKPPLPTAEQSLGEFSGHLGHLVYTGAFPSVKAWTIYWSFFVFEAVCYLVMPGVYTYGKPLPHENMRKLEYYCSGVSSFYFSIAVALGLHVTGLFKLYTLIDEFGPLMSVAIISGFVVSVIAYVSAIVRGAQHRMTGYLIYDFFMGAELNPRMFKWLDFKMFFEVRLPWFILFFLSLGTAARQWETYGYVSGEVGFVLMAHFLYANACCKGEEMIPITWDMYYEKWGFMLIFWNLAGVPLSYCHCTIYLANHHPDTYRWNRFALAGLYLAYVFVYWVWDTANSQKNAFRAQQRGTWKDRRAFPQMPWKTVKNPKTIPTTDGNDLLCDGWYGKARKIHYTCDVFFSLSWAFVTGFNSPFPWFYPLFFCAMISHRAQRDIHRCEERYGDAWKEYTRRVPYLFIPYVF